MKVYQLIGQAAQTANYWIKKDPSDRCGEMLDRCENEIDHLVRNYLPSGGGVDTGCRYHFRDLAKNPNKMVLMFSFHHMDDVGGYDGWTDHRAIVTPSFAYGFEVTITGRDRNGIKEYLHEVFCNALSADMSACDHLHIYDATNSFR